jgi:hypothetical protein
LIGENIPFVNNVKYLGVIFDKKITWRLCIETLEVNDFRTFIRIYSLFRSELLSTNIKLALHEALIRSAMTYACPTWKFVAETHLLYCSYCKTVRTIGSFLSRMLYFLVFRISDNGQRAGTQ